MTDQIEQRLKEIEKRAKYSITDNRSYCTNVDVPALCKALRKYKLAADEYVPDDILFGLEADIARILSGEEGQ